MRAEDLRSLTLDCSRAVFDLQSKEGYWVLFVHLLTAAHYSLALVPPGEPFPTSLVRARSLIAPHAALAVLRRAFGLGTFPSRRADCEAEAELRFSLLLHEEDDLDDFRSVEDGDRLRL